MHQRFSHLALQLFRRLGATLLQAFHNVYITTATLGQIFQTNNAPSTVLFTKRKITDDVRSEVLGEVKMSIVFFSVVATCGYHGFGQTCLWVLSWGSQWNHCSLKATRNFTEHRERVVCTPSYSGSFAFNAWPGDRLSWLRRGFFQSLQENSLRVH